MAIKHSSRIDLQVALVGYMAGRIRTYVFDDRNSACGKSPDQSLQRISKFLYSLHDDFIDHPISVTVHGWEVLQRVVVFLGTDLEIVTDPAQDAWPFSDRDEWLAYQSRLKGFDLPDFDDTIHNCQFQPWWNRISLSDAFLSLGTMLLLGAILASFINGLKK